jgi:hypothetical protein
MIMIIIIHRRRRPRHWLWVRGFPSVGLGTVDLPLRYRPMRKTENGDSNDCQRSRCAKASSGALPTFLPSFGGLGRVL